MENPDTDDLSEDIAIIGLSCRLPGASNVDEFWQNVQAGKESIRFFSDEELKQYGIDPETINTPNYVKASPVLEDIDLFDAAFFGYTPKQAELMDPQQRLFLETAWQALENAGYDPERFPGRIGVFAGESWGTYLLNNLYQNQTLIRDVGLSQLLQGNKDSNLTTRTSYKLNLSGPSMTINTACSTSLVAVVMGCQSLLNYQSDLILAGGVCIKIPQNVGYFFEEGGIVSSDGHCRTFDASAQGTIFGNGIGIVALKRLEDALEDNDTVYAVIKGSAINNDGSMKASFTAPSIEGQTEVIVEAIANAGINPETITLMEAHGTGTYLGDPIEVEALSQAFRSATEEKAYCAIGSVKTNIGHLNTAAGVAGLIKTVMALQHKKLPPTLHFEQPNPRIDFDNTPFYVNTSLRDWRCEGFPRRAGVSSLGVGGTNAHVILEEAPEPVASGDSRPWQLLILSAKSNPALDRASTRLADLLHNQPELNLADAAYTLCEGRHAFSHRRIAVCQDIDDAIEVLRANDPSRTHTSSQETKQRNILFMFPGQGSQYVNMGLDLYHSETSFRNHIDYCSEFLKPRLGLDLRDVLYPDENMKTEAQERLKQTSLTQPALFVIEYALAQLYKDWGIHPQAMIGHSIGEYVAACLAGVFSLDDALSLVAERGRLMQSMPKGTMLSVPLAEDELQGLISGRVSIATVNTPNLCVASGPTEEIDNLENALKERGLECQRLHTSHAFHSVMMEPAADQFRDFLQGVELIPPQTSFISNVTGTWIKEKEATDPGYWARHLRHAVLFSQGVQHFLHDPDQILLEVGPGSTLSSLAMKHATRAKCQTILKSMRHPRESQPDLAFLLTTLGRLWISGIKIDWRGYFAEENRRRVVLPTYPFERKRFWVDATAESQKGKAVTTSTARNNNINEWFYIPSWKRSLLQVPLEGISTSQQEQCTLLFVNGVFGTRFAEQMQNKFQDVFIVVPGSEFNSPEPGVFSINPGHAEDYHFLYDKLNSMGKTPDNIVHLWSLSPVTANTSAIDNFVRTQEFGFYSLLYVSQVIIDKNPSYPTHITAITNNVYDINGDEALQPEKSTILALCKVLPQEHRNISCNNIDIVVPDADSPLQQKLLSDLIGEIQAKTNNHIIAYRGNHRWIQSFEQIRLDKGLSKFKKGGVYMITGGMGQVGLSLAKHLAKNYQANIALLGRSWMPANEDWEKWAAISQDSNNNDTGRLMDGAFDGLYQGDTENKIREELKLKPIGNYTGLEQALNKLCLSYICEFFTATDTLKQVPRVVDLDTLSNELGILPMFRKFLAYLLHVLDEEGLITVTEGKIAFPSDFDGIASSEQMKQALAKDFPQFQGLVTQIEHCAKHFSKALTGKVEAISVLYPDGSPDFLKQCNEKTTPFSSSRVYETLTAELLAEALKNTKQKIRILEIGAGQGKLTWQLASKLKSYEVEYYFSDVGNSFVLAAQKEADKRGLSFMKFGTFDISTDPLSQGFHHDQFDIIIGLNVVHATRNIAETLGNLKTVMTPGGRILLLEGVMPFRWLNMIWGFAEGWWYFDDDNLRSITPLLTTDKWEEVFHSTGFDKVQIYSKLIDGQHKSDFALIVAGHNVIDADIDRDEALLSAPENVDLQGMSIRIRKLLELESLGSQVSTIRADVTDLDQLKAAVKSVCDQFGKLNGVIHAATDKSNFTLINDTTYETTEAHFKPKVYGLYNLEESLKDTEIDFCILLSSNASVLGGHTLTSYTAANLFMDTFACAHNNKNNRNYWLSTNWDRWLPEAESSQHQIARSTEAFSMSSDESTEAFQYISSVDSVSQVVVSAGQLQARIDKWIYHIGQEYPDKEKESGASSTETTSRKQSVSEDPGNDIEREIASICQDVLGINEIGIHDSFFDLGGDSLIFLQIATRLRKSFDVGISFRKLFEVPTVSKLADTVMRELTAGVDNDELEKMVSEIGNLSDEELRDAIEFEK